MKNIFKVLLAVVAVAALSLPMATGSVTTASAEQTWVCWHHVSQGHGPNDQDWTQWMPDDSTNGHNGHDGDYLADDEDCGTPPEPNCEETNSCPPPPPPTCEELGNCPPPTCEELGNCPPPTCEELGNCPPPPPPPGPPSKKGHGDNDLNCGMRWDDHKPSGFWTFFTRRCKFVENGHQGHPELWQKRLGQGEKWGRNGFTN